MFVYINLIYYIMYLCT